MQLAEASRPRCRSLAAQVQARPAQVQARPGLVPGPFGPINWTLGCSGPLVGHVHTPGAAGMFLVHGQWACPWSKDMGHVLGPGTLGMSLVQGQWACGWSMDIGHVPGPETLGMSLHQGPWDPFWGPWDPGWEERAAPGGQRLTFWVSRGGAPGNFTYFLDLLAYFWTT